MKKSKLISIIIYICLIIFTITGALSFFIPYISANDDYSRELHKKRNEYLYYWDSSLCKKYGELDELSLYDFCIIITESKEVIKKYDKELDRYTNSKQNKSYSSNSHSSQISYSGIEIYLYIFILIAILSIVILLLTVLKKNIPSIVLSLVVITLLLFTNASLWPNELYNGSYAFYLYYISYSTIIAGSIYQIIYKKSHQKTPKQTIFNTQNDNQKSWVCPNCHQIAHENFCSKCGNKQVQSSQKVKYCPNCGKMLEITAQFCVKCGTKLTTNN